jgi:hypothetical protein
MAFWRMQLHPNDASNAVKYTTKSLAAGFIGLDFADPPGDLTDVAAVDIEASQRDYWEFAHTMAVGDHVLIIAHHYPHALVRVSGQYNYIRTRVSNIGVWFRHFRAVNQIRYYGDWVTNAAKWERLVMKDTISILHDPGKASFKLMERWLADSE